MSQLFFLSIAADNIVDENAEPYEYDYEYYDEVPEGTSPFVNPYDRTHQTQHLLAGNLAGHLAGHRAAAEKAESKRLQSQALKPIAPEVLRQQVVPQTPLRFFPQGNIKLDRFTDGFNFNFRSNKK